MKCPKKETFAPETCPKCGKTTEVEHYNTGWRCICKCGWCGVFHFDKRCLDCEELHSSNKYGARKTFSSLCDRMFASKAEATRGEELALLERAGEITELEYQPKYKLWDKPRVTYTADFRYRETGKVVVEDVKGILTRETRVKIAWLKEKHGIEVILIR